MEYMKENGIEGDVCSNSWLRRQFEPSNPYAVTSTAFTSRIKMTMMVQRRDLSGTHIDLHYTNAHKAYLRQITILANRSFNDVVSFQMDDKAVVRFGPPGHPARAIDRNRRSLGNAELRPCSAWTTTLIPRHPSSLLWYSRIASMLTGTSLNPTTKEK